MKNKILITSLAALFVGGMSTASLAGDYMRDSAMDVTDAGAPDITEETFVTIDANGDGMISVEEAQGSSTLKDGISSADTNQDGSLDVSEFSAFEAAQ
jgi:hypothetical protein